MLNLCSQLIKVSLSSAWAAYFFKMSFSEDHCYYIETRDHDMSTPSEYILSFIKTSYISVRTMLFGSQAFDHFFFKFRTNIPFCNSLESFDGQKNPKIVASILFGVFPNFLVFGKPNIN